MIIIIIIELQNIKKLSSNNTLRIYQSIIVGWIVFFFFAWIIIIILFLWHLFIENILFWCLYVCVWPPVSIEMDSKNYGWMCGLCFFLFLFLFMFVFFFIRHKNFYFVPMANTTIVKINRKSKLNSILNRFLNQKNCSIIQNKKKNTFDSVFLLLKVIIPSWH